MDFKAGKPILDDEEFLGPAVSEDGLVQCVFSSMEKIKVGTGTTTRQHVTKIYWYIQELERKAFSTRQINSNHVPAGEEKIINLQSLMDNFLPEVEFWEEKTVPAMRELETLIEDGEADREDGKFYSAERSFQKALGIEEQNVRALFNLGLVYLELDAMDKARDMMTELLKLKTEFRGKDQHLFNEFGISLRKNHMYEEAVTYYNHALKYIQDDENLYYNLSRSYYEKGDWIECANALSKSRALDPEMPAANDLSSLIMELAKKPDLCRKYGKNPIPNDVAGRILGMLKEGGSKADAMKVRTGDVLKPEVGRARSAGVIQIDRKN